ncbi:hypothetical protein HOV23_gp127 [Pseudomonas phage Lana]|uniref:Uncharacterized protein n=1 Tax=Pseudomonas phage Lana TaxID=2530172 RepID=A0A481W5U1_9CAUD|nr:hypothetical protein HOV23_gp127 [Pseudomonas phage Lana]QBJ04446.1 hypothetical protein [Pseudomonas phage Lana]
MTPSISVPPSAQAKTQDLPQIDPATVNPTPPADMVKPSHLGISMQEFQARNCQRTTRLKMTLHYLDVLPGDADNPLTRCTFGAVYSKDKTEEDYVFGKYTPYGNLSYNVRSDLAEHLVVGQAYYIDIHAVPT